VIVVINIIYTIGGTYRITTVLKVKTDIIVSMAASSIGRAVILVIMYVKTSEPNRGNRLKTEKNHHSTNSVN
jgi:Mg2+/citrate symporter